MGKLAHPEITRFFLRTGSTGGSWTQAAKDAASGSEPENAGQTRTGAQHEVVFGGSSRGHVGNHAPHAATVDSGRGRARSRAGARQARASVASASGRHRPTAQPMCKGR